MMPYNCSARWRVLVGAALCLLLGPAMAQGAATVHFEPTAFEQMHEFYTFNKERGRATLITSDSVLHSAHILFDYTLRAAELQRFDAHLRELSAAMMTRMTALAEEEARKRYIQPPPPYNYLRVAAYFGVAYKLQHPDREAPECIRPLVEQEVQLILAHQGQQRSPVMGVIEDYTQYVPRGHYTRNAQFRRYFLAMMWLGRAGFPISGEKAPGVMLTREEARENAWAGIMLARNLDRSPLYRHPNSPTYLGRWESIYRPTQFIVGASDDLTPPEVAALSERVFGATLPGAWMPEAQAQTDRFITEAIKLRPARLFGTVQTDAVTAPPVAVRLFGQRFTPDGDIFQRVVHPQVTERLLPSGLDVMAALGSPRAVARLTERGEFAKYPAYGKQLATLQQEFHAMPEAGWRQTAYLLWMRTLRDLVQAPSVATRTEATDGDPQYPAWWSSTAWQDKQLNAALGSWAELRHDTILYVKQTYTVGVTSMPATPKEAPIYVEPAPEVYQGIHQLLETLQQQLTAQGVFPEELAPNYRQFLRLLTGLRIRSHQQLYPGIQYDKRAVTAEAAEGLRLIPQIGDVLRAIETLPAPLRDQLTGDEDAKMALIADVHTDPNTEQVLEVGVGRVMAVVAPVTVGNAAVQAYGPVFSYYEFAQPVAQRLTDAAWQEMLARGRTCPPLILGSYVPQR